MNYLSDDLADELVSKYLYIKSRIDFPIQRLKAEKTERRAIEKMAQIHSFRMENPDLEVPFSVPTNCNRQKIKKGIGQLKRAFKWGCENFDPKNFDESFIRGLAIRVLPEAYEGRSIANYRDMGTSISGASVTPPYPMKLRENEIPKFEKVMQSRLRSLNPLDTIETSIFAHFHVARIHPFIDGNGRTARILQDVILHDKCFPMPIIEAGERMTYYHLLDKAVYDWKHQNNWEYPKKVTEGEHLFYDFMGGKINISLDKLLGIPR